MKQHLLAAATLAVLAAAPGSSLAADRTWADLPPFTGIDISSGIDAVVTVGPTQSVAGTAANQQT